MDDRRSPLAGLGGRLALCFAAISLGALLLAGSVFVVLERPALERQAADRLVAARILDLVTDLTYLWAATAEAARPDLAIGEDGDIRVLLVDAAGRVAADSEGTLRGTTIAAVDDDYHLTSAVPVSSWKLGQETMTDGSLLFAVPHRLVGGAWLRVLPSLVVSAAIALPLAVLAGVLVARHVTRPLRRLTLATHEIAAGRWAVDVPVDRSDEVGVLARAFETMARHVGQTNSRMRELVANVSHDLRTPLTTIIGFAQALRDGAYEDDADARRLAGVVHEEALRLGRRMRDLLYLSELDAGQAVLERERVQLRRLLEEATGRVEPLLASRQMRLERRLEPVDVSGDPAKLERIVENLLENSRRFTPGGGVVSVELTRAGSAAHVRIANTAPPIDAEELPRLFERFYRRRRGGGEEGSGLGLSIARELVELHGGTIDARLEGDRIVFALVLPSAHVEAGTDGSVTGPK